FPIAAAPKFLAWRGGVVGWGVFVGEDAGTRRLLRNGVGLHGFTVLGAESGDRGLRGAALNTPGRIHLGRANPGLPGADILDRIRSWSDVPIIVLSSVADESEKVRLLRMGADDYVVKPFSVAELLARSDAVLRRNLRSTNRQPVVRVGALSIDLVSRVV